MVHLRHGQGGWWSNLSYDKPYFRIITNYSDWTAFLDDQGYFTYLNGGPMRLEGEIFPGGNKTPKMIRPADFDNYFILAAMMGRKNYAEGPEIEIKNIRRLDNLINVTVRWYDRRGGAAVQSAPYHIVIVKREVLPAGNSTFNFIDTEGKNLGEVSQKLPVPNETKPLIINDTFVTWSRGYWSNLSYGKPYFRVITNYNDWISFLDEQGVGVDGKLTLEGTLFPGLGTTPKTIDTADFNNYFIIAAMMATKSYAEEPEIEIKNISRINNVINVTVRIYDVARGALIPSAPYHIVIVKRELLTMGNSTFVFINTEGKEIERQKVRE